VVGDDKAVRYPMRARCVVGGQRGTDRVVGGRQGSDGRRRGGGSLVRRGRGQADVWTRRRLISWTRTRSGRSVTVWRRGGGGVFAKMTIYLALKV
jgi:hypothetical protein